MKKLSILMTAAVFLGAISAPAYAAQRSKQNKAQPVEQTWTTDRSWNFGAAPDYSGRAYGDAYASGQQGYPQQGYPTQNLPYPDRPYGDPGKH